MVNINTIITTPSMAAIVTFTPFVWSVWRNLMDVSNDQQPEINNDVTSTDATMPLTQTVSARRGSAAAPD